MPSILDRAAGTDRAVAAYLRFCGGEVSRYDVVPNLISDLLHWYQLYQVGGKTPLDDVAVRSFLDSAITVYKNDRAAMEEYGYDAVLEMGSGAVAYRTRRQRERDLERAAPRRRRSQTPEWAEPEYPDDAEFALSPPVPDADITVAAAREALRRLRRLQEEVYTDRNVVDSIPDGPVGL